VKNDKIEIIIRVPSQTRYLGLIGKIGEDVARTAKRYPGDREELAYHVNLVLTEAMSNAIRHANVENPDKQLHISICIEGNQLFISVFDEGGGFEMDQVPHPDVEYLDEGGRGIYIIRTLMDRVDFRKQGRGHVLEMSKTLN